MAERYRHNRPSAIRQPLTEIPNHANTPPMSSKQTKTLKVVSISPQHLPHNESLDPNGSLAVRPSMTPSSPENKRVSQITSEHDRDSKRNSAISTTSTNASSGRRRKTYIGHWQLGKTIGKGGCSRVRVVRHRFKDQYGAVKIITRSTAENTRAQSLANLIENTKGNSSLLSAGKKPIPFGLEREIAIMKLLEHPNIVRLYDVWENRNELYLIMEYVDGGELFHYVGERRGLPEDESVLIFRQIVSALLYCHRMRICHRDLKPENILLDQRDLTVKLIDFGMAALQPEGRQLSTPCGSPHYAAPEVVSGKPYDGTQADVWSCGVILYVILTGTTPYNYSEQGDIRVLFRDIAKAKYWMPPDLSNEAKDLIRRIFVPEPGKRITMDEVWNHPLLHKYDKKLGFEGQNGTKDAAIGPIPSFDDWKLKRTQDVDREILRNMRTLWHSEPEQILIQKLVNEDYNQEKLFYAALIKHREEHLENYVSDLDDVDYSASDYHHSQPVKTANAPPLPPVPRTQSQYSIMNDEHFRQVPNFGEVSASISSYDPYRASKDPLINVRSDYANITVHRRGSANRWASVGKSLRHPNALRVEMLKHNSTTRTSNTSSSNLARSRRSRSSMRRSSVSRYSMNSSSNWAASPPVIATMRPSAVHKRGVSFGHIRRTSTASALTSHGSAKPPATPKVPDTARPSIVDSPKDLLNSSPSAIAAHGVRSRKEKAQLLNMPRIKVRKPESGGQNMRSEIRKHSAELEKACEEAFFRSSVSSSILPNTPTTERQGSYDTPPSTVSTHESRPQLPELKPTGRPLPQIPKDTPNTYLSRTLEETRKKLAAYRPSDEDNNAKFDEVMKMLENIMPASQKPPVPEHRIHSAGEAKTAEHGFLSIISEEGDARNAKNDQGRHRSVTAPVKIYRPWDDKTVRVVDSPSSSLVAPLNVRKRSSGSDTSMDDSQRRLNMKSSTERLVRKRSLDPIGVLASIEEDEPLPVAPPVVRKKKSWFGLGRKTPVEQAPAPVGDKATQDQATPSASHRLKRPSKLLLRDKSLPEDPPLTDDSSEFPLRKKRFGSRGGFTRWLGRQNGETNSATGDTTFPNQSIDSFFSAASPPPPSNDGPPTAGPERSWFARFFHVKPAVKVLCFSIPRGRARQELIILLREWQRHGIRDLEYSRETNTISARIDKENSLDIKPVAFRVELFVVLEHGRKVGLSIARFVQVKGAASGFRRALEVVDGVMRGRGWLIEDEEKWKALSQIVTE